MRRSAKIKEKLSVEVFRNESQTEKLLDNTEYTLIELSNLSQHRDASHTDTHGVTQHCSIGRRATYGSQTLIAVFTL